MRKLIRNLGRRWNDVWNRFVLRMRRKALILDLRQNFTPLETRQVLASSAFNPGLGALSVQLDNGETATLTQNLDQFVLDLPGTSSDLSGSIANLLRIEVAGVGPGNNGTFLWGGSSNNDFSLVSQINLSVQDLLSTDVNVKAQEIIIQGDSSSSSFTLINSGIVQITNEPGGPFNFTDTFSITTSDSLANIRLDGDLQATSSATSPDVTFRTLGSDASIFIDGDIALVGDPSATPNSTLTIETSVTGGAPGSNVSFISSQITTTDDATVVSVRALGGSIDMDPSSSINAMDGTIEFQANTSIRFTGLSSTSTDVQAIRVISLTGELIDADSLGNDADATNGGILLNAVTGIGNSDALEVKVGVLSAINSTSGRISLNNQSSPGDGDLTLNIVENSFREIEIFNQSSGIQQSPTGRIVGNQVTLVADASVFDLANLDTPLRTSLNKSIVLTNSTNAIASFFGLATGEIRLTTQSDLNLVALRAQESVLSGPSLEFQSTPGINQIVIESLNSNITQGSGSPSGILTHSLSATASSGSVTLGNVSNNAQFVTGSSQGDFLFTDANGFEVQGIRSSQGKVAIATRAGSITQRLSPSDGIIANELSVLVDTESNPTPNQISIDGWGRNSILLNSANNDVGQVEAVASGSIQFVNKDSFQVGRIAAVAKDFVAGSVVSGVTAANEVVLETVAGSITQGLSPSDGIIANKLSVLVDTESNPTPNQISIDGWGRNSILLNSANNDVGQVEAVASGSIQFVNKDSFQVGRIAAVAKDFVAGSVVSGVTAANEV
ncbi:MAG: beta strand repeat-containing protein, partial [Pirellula sp.]